MESKEPKKKRYSPPTLTKLTPEQARTLLADHKNCGEEEAADLLGMQPTRNQNTATDQKRKCSA
jgi:hypothetical protein